MDCSSCILIFSFAYSFQDKIAKCRYWPVEVMRLPQPAAAKGKKVSSIFQDIIMYV